MRTQIQRLAIAAGLALASAAASSAFAAGNPAVGGAAMDAKKTIVENASAATDLSTLVTALKAAGLVDTLAGKGPFTVFAPTNAAFEKLPAGTVDGLLKPEAKDQLTKILTCHVVPAKAMAADVAKMIADGSGSAKIATVGGCEFTAKAEGDKVMIEDGQGNMATVTAVDLAAGNGVVHVIDTVLLPAN